MKIRKKACFFFLLLVLVLRTGSYKAIFNMLIFFCLRSNGASC